MPSFNIIRESQINRTPRVAQLEGIFDIPPAKQSKIAWNGEFNYPDDWSVGVIVGPSGAGKTTLARELYDTEIITGFDWNNNNCIVDDFPKTLSIKDITACLSSVGFSSPPAWLRPFSVLSNGEQFRATLARALTLDTDIIVIDEFTSVVDRTVAQIGSAAIAKTVRRKNKKLVAVSVHYDILDWLEPDWVYQPHTGEYYTGRYLHRRPKIELQIKRVHHSIWRIFRHHHYLDTGLNKASMCFCAFYKEQPVAFTAVLHFPHPKARNIKREHRTVCFPDFQGVGIGNALSDWVGGYFKNNGFRFQSQTSNPAMVHSRNRSKNWATIRKYSRVRDSRNKNSAFNDNGGKWRPSNTRYTATFEYCGPALNHTGKTPVLIE